MGASASSPEGETSSADWPHGMRCLSCVLEICDLLEKAAAKRGKAYSSEVSKRTTKLRVSVQSWEAESQTLSSLSGSQVLEVAAAMKVFDERLFRCKQKAKKMTKMPAMFSTHRRFQKRVGRILMVVEAGQLMFKDALRKANGEASLASSLKKADSGYSGNAESVGSRIAARMAVANGKGRSASKGESRVVEEPEDDTDSVLGLAPTVMPEVADLPGACSETELEELKYAARRGDTAAAFTLGQMYRHGIPCAKQDAAEAVKYFKQAANADIPAACYALGQMVEAGEGFAAPSRSEAAGWYKKASDKGHVEGMTEYAFLLEHGHEVEKDEKAALALYKKAAAGGSGRAMNNLGKMLFDGRGAPMDRVAAVSWFRRATESGSTAALTNLGICYEDGLGVGPDPYAAETCFRQAAAAGHTRARVSLGYIAVRRQHFKKAKMHFEVAAEEGDADALYCLATLAEREAGMLDPGSPRSSRGSGVVAAQVEAAEHAHTLFWKAANAGDARAQYWVANAYWDDGDYESALFYYQAAANQHHAGALNALGIIKEEGQGGLAPDPQAALDCYRLAAAAGSAEAQDNLLAVEQKLGGLAIGSDRGGASKEGKSA